MAAGLCQSAMKEIRVQAGQGRATQGPGGMLRVLLGFAAIAALLSLAGCGDNATLPIKAQTGSNLRLPPPDPELIPTVNIAPAEAWTAGATGGGVGF